MNLTTFYREKSVKGNESKDLKTFFFYISFPTFRLKISTKAFYVHRH